MTRMAKRMAVVATVLGVTAAVAVAGTGMAVARGRRRARGRCGRR